MLRGVYVANTAMVSQQLKETVISQNLANMNTTGYKADAVAFGSFPEVLVWRLKGNRQTPIGTAGFGVAVAACLTDLREGPLVATGRPLDVALAGPGYFVLESPEGETFYTRNGSFRTDAEGYLVNEQGYFVLGEDGRLAVGGGEIAVREDGVIVVDGEERGRLLAVEFDDPRALAKAGANLFRLAGEANVTQAQGLFHSGYLEGANVGLVQNMVDLLSGLRAYEAAQRVLRTQDELLARAAGEVGTLR